MKTTQQVIASLPAECFGVLPATKEVIKIKAGEIGFYKVCQPPAHVIGSDMAAFVDKLNAEDGITKAQRQAMQHGSMFGWHTHAANPENYTEDGTLRKDRLPKVDNSKSLWVVVDDTYERPRYLDGFRDDITPVWLSDLQRIDPFCKRETAEADAERSGGRVQRVIIDDNGVTR